MTALLLSVMCNVILCMLPYSRSLSWNKTFADFVFLRQFAKVFSPKKSIFEQLDTTLVGVVHWVTIRYRASGCGALGYH